MAAVLTSKKQTVTLQIPKQGDLLFEGRAKELFAFENQSLIENTVKIPERQALSFHVLSNQQYVDKWLIPINF